MRKKKVQDVGPPFPDDIDEMMPMPGAKKKPAKKAASPKKPAKPKKNARKAKPKKVMKPGY